MKWQSAGLFALTVATVGCVQTAPKKEKPEPIAIDTSEDAFEPDEVTVQTEAGDELVIELTWNTPGDADQTDKDGADVDLHFRHPDGGWNEEPYDIFWGNPTADWGDEGASDDPVLQLDDSDGRGPELLTYSGMSGDVPFEIGVHYYADNGFGASYATVRIFHHGERVLQRDTRLEEGEFWSVAELQGGEVRLVDVVDGEMP